MGDEIQKFNIDINLFENILRNAMNQKEPIENIELMVSNLLNIVEFDELETILFVIN